jgi:hypothetical protein
VGLGCSYLLAIVLLGPLLGSSADASTAFSEHFAEDGNRLRDLLGSFALLVAAGSLVWTVVAARSETSSRVDGPLRDLTAAAGVVTASVLVVASGLLVTVPATTAIGELTDDPGIDPAVQAGIAQAGTVMLLVAALCLALTTLLVARLGRRSDAVPRWVVVTAWVTAATLVLGVTVVLLVPFAAWAIAVGLVWAGEPR